MSSVSGGGGSRGAKDSTRLNSCQGSVGCCSFKGVDAIILVIATIALVVGAMAFCYMCFVGRRK